MSLIDTMLYWVHDNLWYALIESNYVCRFIRPVLNTVEDKAHAYPVYKKSLNWQTHLLKFRHARLDALSHLNTFVVPNV